MQHFIESSFTKAFKERLYSLDYFNVNTAASQAANVGGNWNNNLGNSGPFNCNVNNASSNSNTNYTARVVAAFTLTAFRNICNSMDRRYINIFKSFENISRSIAIMFV